METIMYNPTVNKNQLKIYSSTVLWINEQKLYLKYKKQFNVFDLNSINSAILIKEKNKNYQFFIFSFTLFFIVYYFINFNWYLFGFHILSYVFSFLYLKQYDYFFTLSMNNSHFKIKIEPSDKSIFKEFLKDFYSKKALLKAS